jgi:hypothetical protein
MGFNHVKDCFLNEISYYIAVNLEKPYAGCKAVSFKIQGSHVLTLKASKKIKNLT